MALNQLIVLTYLYLFVSLNITDLTRQWSKNATAVWQSDWFFLLCLLKKRLLHINRLPFLDFNWGIFLSFFIKMTFGRSPQCRRVQVLLSSLRWHLVSTWPTCIFSPMLFFSLCLNSVIRKHKHVLVGKVSPRLLPGPSLIHDAHARFQMPFSACSSPTAKPLLCFTCDLLYSWRCTINADLFFPSSWRDPRIQSEILAWNVS